MEIGDIASRVKTKQFYAMMVELSLIPKYEKIMFENGFDEWSSIIELNPEILKEIGISDELDTQQILACVKAAESLKINVDDYSNRDNILEEDFRKYEIEEEYEEQKDEEFDAADETLGIEMKKKFFTEKKMIFNIKMLEKASYQDCMRNDTLYDFSRKIISLYLMNKGYEKMVKFKN